MSGVVIESSRPGTVPRGEQTARVELAALGDRLRQAAHPHDGKPTVAELLEDVSRVWHRATADLGTHEEGR